MCYICCHWQTYPRQSFLTCAPRQTSHTSHTYLFLLCTWYAVRVVLKEAPFLLACVPRLLPHVYFYTHKVTSYTMDQSNLLTHIVFAVRVVLKEARPFLACLRTKILPHMYFYTHKVTSYTLDQSNLLTHTLFLLRAWSWKRPLSCLLAYQDCCLTCIFTHLKLLHTHWTSRTCSHIHCFCCARGLGRGSFLAACVPRLLPHKACYLLTHSAVELRTYIKL